MSKLIPISIVNHAEVWKDSHNYVDICNWNSIWSSNIDGIDFHEGEQGYDYEFVIHMDPEVFARWLSDTVSRTKSSTDIYKVTEDTLALILLQVSND